MPQRSIVLIPCWRREEFLNITLERIQLAKQADKNVYVFLIDRGFHTSIVELAKRFPLEKIIKFAPSHRYNGNSYNVLSGYRYALDIAGKYNADLVHLIEEDIQIGVDYFDFHEKVQNQFDCFGVTACRNQMDQTERPKDIDKVYYFDAYQSLGVSFKLDTIEKIARHNVDEFCRSSLRYVKSHFSKSKLGNIWTEQDGLIRRIEEQDSKKMIFPQQARAYHFGWVGYNRKGKSLDGSLEQKVARIKTMTDAEMNEMAGVYKDIESIDLDKDNQVETFTCLS